MTKPAPTAPHSLEQAVERVLRAGGEPLRAAYLARALNGLARLAPRLGDQALADAAGATSDYATLLQSLEEPEALAALRRDDPLAGARLRGLRARAQLLEAEGGTLRTEDVAKLLGITRQAVDKRRRAGRLLALSLGRRGSAYPAWQFGADSVLPGLEDLLRELPVRDPWTQAAFFLSPNSYLDGERPLAALRGGDVAAVRRAASAYGEQGAP